MPRFAARSAPMISPVKARRLASCRPMRLGSSHDVPKSRLRPRLAKIRENRALGEHHTMSAARAIPKPAPTATPSTLAITGRGQSCMAITVSAMSRMWSVRCRRGWSPASASSPGPTSAPAQKSPPAPVITTARAEDSAMSRNPCRSPAHMAGVQAFLRRGRSMVTVVTAPEVPMWMLGCVKGCSRKARRTRQVCGGSVRTRQAATLRSRVNECHLRQCGGSVSHYQSPARHGRQHEADG